MKKITFLFFLILLEIRAFAEDPSIDVLINEGFQPVTDWITSVVFYSVDVTIGQNVVSVPLIVVWLLVGSVVFTVYFRFINFRLFGLALDVVRGKYSSKEEEGEVSHFQALTAALSSTVGMGNISGVAIAVCAGGPGATFWLIVAGLLGMSTKFVECTLGVKFRDIDKEGVVHGGPMYYLSKGFSLLDKENKSKFKMSTLGKVLAVFFALFCIGGSLGGGNMFQVQQAYKQFVSLSFFSETWISYNAWFFGLVFALLVAVVIIGGIKSIAKVTDKIVPFMCGFYMLAALLVIAMHYDKIFWAFGEIISGAFNPEAMYGGVLGVLLIGVKRAAFSNEAGVGSAPIAHSAVKTEHPASEGIVSLLEPFIDTVIICTITGVMLVITETYKIPEIDGVLMTSYAFETVFGSFAGIILTVAVLLFAFSTMVSWSYYGMQAWEYLFGVNKISEMVYKLVYCLFVVIGSSLTLGAVTDFSDMMVLAMAFPNIIGLYFLMPYVKKELNYYVGKIRNGEIKRVD